MAPSDCDHERSNTNNDDIRWPQPRMKQQQWWCQMTMTMKEAIVTMPLQDQNHEKSSSNNSNGVKQSQPPKTNINNAAKQPWRKEQQQH